MSDHEKVAHIIQKRSGAGNMVNAKSIVRQKVKHAKQKMSMDMMHKQASEMMQGQPEAKI